MFSCLFGPGWLFVCGRVGSVGVAGVGGAVWVRLGLGLGWAGLGWAWVGVGLFGV